MIAKQGVGIKETGTISRRVVVPLFGGKVLNCFSSFNVRVTLL
jgi:hypothetical protein